MTSDCNSDDGFTAKENLSSDYKPSNVLQQENNIYSRISATVGPWCIQASVSKSSKGLNWLLQEVTNVPPYYDVAPYIPPPNITST